MNPYCHQKCEVEGSATLTKTNGRQPRGTTHEVRFQSRAKRQALIIVCDLCSVSDDYGYKHGPIGFNGDGRRF